MEDTFTQWWSNLLDGGHESFDGLGHTLGVVGVQLVCGRVLRIDGQLFGRCHHVTCPVNHRLTCRHNGLLGLPCLHV